MQTQWRWITLFAAGAALLLYGAVAGWRWSWEANHAGPSVTVYPLLVAVNPVAPADAEAWAWFQWSGWIQRACAIIAAGSLMVHLALSNAALSQVNPEGMPRA